MIGCIVSNGNCLLHLCGYVFFIRMILRLCYATIAKLP